MAGLPNYSPRRTRQHSRPAVDKGSSGQRRQVTSTTPYLSSLRLLSTGMVAEYAAERMTYRVTDGMAGKASSTKVAARVTANASVLRIQIRRNKERNGKGKQKAMLAIHGQSSAHRQFTPTGCRLGAEIWLSQML